MFIDETATSTAMAHACGRAERGIVATMVLDGAMSGALFRAYTEQIVAPALAPGRYRDRGQPGRAQGRWRGPSQRRLWLFYLPPYSPDPNPIEMAFAKLKALLRATEARTRTALWDGIAEVLNQFLSAECRNMMAAASRHHRLSSVGPTPISRAIWLALVDDERANSTASALNSTLYCLRCGITLL